MRTTRSTRNFIIQVCKRLLMLGLVLALVSLSLLQPGWPAGGQGAGVAYAAGEELVNETFDGMTAGSTPAGWGVNATGSSHVRVEESGGRKFLQIYDASVLATNGIGKTFGPRTDNTVIQFDFQIPSGGTPGKENVLFYVIDAAGKAAIALNVFPNGISSYRTVSGNTTSTQVAGGLTGGQWRQLTLAANVAGKTFDVYIDGVQTANDVPFRYDDALNLNQLQVTGAYFGDGSSNIRIVNVDNMLIYSGDLQWPAAPVLTADQDEPYLGRAIAVTFADNPGWRSKVYDVAVNGASVSGATYSLTAGELQLAAGLFPAAGNYAIAIKAHGYSNAEVTQTVAEEPPLMLVDETFEAMAPGSTPAGWGVYTTGDSSATIAEEGGNRYLKVVDVSTQGSQGFFRSFAAQTNKLTVEADVRLPAGGTADKDGILFYIRDTAGKSAIALTMIPTGIFSLRTTASGTTSLTLASGLTAGEWRSLKIAADFTLKKFDFYVDDQLLQAGVPFRYDDATDLAGLLVAGAYYADAQSYTRLADVDNVRIYPGATLVTQPEPEPVVPPLPGTERYSFDSYSSVFLSSRWYYPTAAGGKLGTLDAIKRFMATDSKWMYEYNPEPIGNVVRLGVSFQGTLNMNMGQGGRAKLFDGTDLVAPWMASWGATWGSMSDPVYYDIVLQSGKDRIDAGVTSFQFDDWRGSLAAYEMNGDFCDPCMSGFRDYLDETYDDIQLAAWGVADIATFNYRTYLQSTLNIQTNGNYAQSKTLSPLNGPFGDFMKKESRLFHERLHADLEAYAGHELEFSVNASILQAPQLKDHYMHDLFQYEIGESSEASLALPYVVGYGSLASGLGKPQIISSLPYHADKIRQGIASAYALGQYMLVPWDIWLEGSTRYYGTVEEYGDLYHFIRQYSELFDGHDVPAKVGVLVDWGTLTPGTLTDLSMRLFEAGVPFRDLVASSASPQLSLQPGQFEGLDTLIAYSPLSAFSSADQAVIAASGLTVVQPSAVDAAWLSARSAVTIEGGDELYATVRAEADVDGSSSVHLLNEGAPVENAVVTLTDTAFYGSQAVSAVLYQPGRNPLPLATAAAGAGKRSVTIPELNEWAILRVQPADAVSDAAYAVDAPWSGFSVGNPAKAGGAEVAAGLLQIASEGRGLHVPTSGDSGSSDQLSYVYQKLEATPLQDAAISARLLTLPSEAPAGASAGLMIRETAASNAKFVAASYVKGSGLKLQWRDADDGSIGSADLGNVSLPGYIKLERHAGTYAVYYSADGVQWGSPLGTHANSSIRAPLAGAYAAAGTGAAGDEATASFEQLTASAGDIALPEGELSELLMTGLPETMLLGQTAQLTLTAVVEDGGSSTNVAVTGETIAYTVGDTDVVTVNRYGLVEARGLGTTTVTASFMAGGVTVTANAEVTVAEPSPYLIDETFDSYDTQTVPDGWAFSQVAAGGSYIRVEPYPDAANRSLAAYDNTATGFPSAGAVFEPQADPITVDFDFQVDFGATPANGGAIAVYLQGVDGATSAVSLLASPSGYWYLDGSTSVTVAPVIENEWQHIRIIAYPATDKMDLYVDGVRVVTQGNFRNPVEAIGRLMVGGSTGGVDTTARWDNVRVKKGLPESAVTLRPESSGVWAPGETKTIIVGVDQEVGQQLSGVGLTIGYDASKLIYSGATVTDNDWTVVVEQNNAVAGQLTLAALGLGSQAAVAGAADLLRVSFQVRAQAADGPVVFTVGQAEAGNSQGQEWELGGGQLTVSVATPAPGADKTALTAAIGAAESLLSEAEEGIEVGQYIPGTLTAQAAALQTAINAAKAVRDDGAATPGEVQQAETVLQTAVDLFQSYRVLSATGDVNGDGKIGIGDLTLIAYVYGKTQADADWADISSADLNRDGAIDLADLSFAASRWQGV